MLRGFFRLFTPSENQELQQEVAASVSDSKESEQIADEWLFNWLYGFLTWCPTSYKLLQEAEQKMLSCVKKQFSLTFVSIPGLREGDEPCKIRTLTMNYEEKQRNFVPLVLLHGMGGGVGLWVFNLDSLSEQGPLYAIDILGFGMSSRPMFSSNAETAEEQLIQSIEEWRKKMNLKQVILLGHSFGGFLATAYAIKYPDRVCSLILAEPWGFPEKPEIDLRTTIPSWAKYFVRYFNPLALLRAAGPLGPQLITKYRNFIVMKYTAIVGCGETVKDYLYHLNAQVPSGESAFQSMSEDIRFAKSPMVNRIKKLSKNVPITFIYGRCSWIDREPGFCVKHMRPNSHVSVHILQFGGHQVFVDCAKEFNTLVLEVCQKVNTESS